MRTSCTNKKGVSNPIISNLQIKLKDLAQFLNQAKYKMKIGLGFVKNLLSNFV